MAEPTRALAFSVLKKRVNQARKQLHGQWFKSEVVKLLNKPPSKANSNKCTGSGLLKIQQFWHDLRLAISFQDVGLVHRGNERERAVAF
jgi:hypothetical protein